VRNECKRILEYIAQVAGGMGYNLIMCSQYPVGDILPRLVKQNSDARISFRLPTSTASNVILDESGAEDIAFGMRGRAIYKADQKHMMQVPFMDNKMIDELINPMKVSEIIDYEPAEEDGEGTLDHANTEDSGVSEQVPATEHSFFRYEA
jgi:S-DNA-T family DNA segregation ATPase FtsK/SpoIIIE